MNDLNWKNFFLKDLDFTLAAEIMIRSCIMFIIILVFLRSTGKKGIRQLSIFEVAIIIALGSAAGDPMLNQESAILPSLLVFVVILIVYRTLTYFAAKNQKIENLLEGEPQYIIEDGKFTLKDDGDGNFAKDEFFAEMRIQSIEHVGQVRTAILETNGQVSFLYFEDDQVKFGLPIYPKLYNKKSEHFVAKKFYACTYCGQTSSLTHAIECFRCGKNEWVEAIDTRRCV